MAVTEGIRSPFRTQPLAHSPKLRVYESLYLLNQKFEEAVRLLRRLEKCPGLRRDYLRAFQVEVEELRAETNSELAEILLARELKDWGRFGKLRRQRDKRFEDPDDVYINVERREQERKRKGLPPRVGVVPLSAVADAERMEPEQERKKKRGKKRRR